MMGSKSDLSETETLELKKSTSELKEAVISVASMLNKHGKGVLYFGIRNDGKALGQEVGERTIRDVSQALSENIEPRIYPKISKDEIDGKTCIKVEFSGNNKPYYAYGRAYMRVGDEDRQLSAKELEEMILHKNKDKLRWDTAVCEKAGFVDISPKKLRSFLKEAELKFDTIENSLLKLGLLSDGKILNAAVILFGKNLKKFFPNARLRCAVFGTKDTSFPIDMQDYSGDLFTLIETAQKYVLEHINVGMRLEGLYRVDVPEIDKDAFREAIINAFCHRDYYEYDSVNIAIFRDRLEIRSPGGLYGGLTIKDITTKHVSKRRNELIADMFNKIHLVEKWGRGIELILSKAPQTTFSEVAGIFITTFKRKTPEDYAPENVPENVPENRLTKIIELMKQDPKITIPTISEKLKVNEKTVKRDIQRLKKQKIIKRIGPDKGGQWEVAGE